MASTPDAVKEVLIKKSADYAGRQQTYSVMEGTLGMYFVCNFLPLRYVEQSGNRDVALI